MFATAAPRRLIPGLLLTAACLLAAGNAPAATVVDTQRSAFKQAYASALQGGEQWRGQASELRDYPLYAYLEAASIEHDIRQTDSATVQDYLSRYPDAIPASDLRRHFLSELARRQDWSHFLTLYQPGLGDALTCQALQARVANGEKLNFERDLAALWAKPNLPGACDTVLAAANSQGLLTNARLWARIEHAIDAGQPGTAASLATWLPPADATVAQRLAQALRDPSASLNAATGWPNTVHNTQAVTLALARLARRQSTRADTAWQQLQSRFSFSTAQRNKVLHLKALRDEAGVPVQNVPAQRVEALAP
ncbi:MAG: transglycosylase SLT domain-containing protein, partial [Rhodanobacter sp.]